MIEGTLRLRFALLSALVLAAVFPVTGSHAAVALSIRTLSNRADLISGGDALVEVVLPKGADPNQTRVELNGHDISGSFAVRVNGRFEGLVTALRDGANAIVARLGSASSKITITNHPIGGPVFSGPQVQPWVCTTSSNGLGAAADSRCNAPPMFELLYKPNGSSSFSTYDPNDPPSDVSTTTTDQGRTVPYVIRRERGAMNRGLYQIVVLFDPSKPWNASESQPQWNHKLLYVFGGGCNTNHGQGSFDDSVLIDHALSRGVAVATSTLNILGHNCNTVTSAESVMMLKEHIVERYGDIRYTIATGGSGGAIGQLAVANAYPGLIQGLMPQATFPDTWTTALEVLDCHLLLTYFARSPHLWANVDQMTAVNGHSGVTQCAMWEVLFAPVENPSHGCGLLMAGTLPTITVPTPDDYNPVLNRRGCRATIQDLQIGVWGRRQQDGFAKFVFDNVGVQYGLRALQAHSISVDQFLDLNEGIGGISLEFLPTAGRSVADPGTPQIAYRTGQVNDARGLHDVAIIDLPPYSDDIHTAYHAFALEQRLMKAFGEADNHVIWRGRNGPFDDLTFDTMDDWLSSVEADTSTESRALKVARNRPKAAADACWIDDERITDGARCDAAYPTYGDARIAAGGPLSHDIMKCATTPPVRSDYPAMSDAQWARVGGIFPNGVCDWKRPSFGYQPSVPWMSYAGGPGGAPLGAASPAARSSALGKSTAGRMPRSSGRSLPATGVETSVAAWLLLGTSVVSGLILQSGRARTERRNESR